MKKIFTLIFIIVSINLLSKEFKLTPYSIYAGAHLNYNLYISNFKELQGYTSYVPNYDFADGLAYSANIGFNYKFPKKIYRLFESVDLKLSYQNISANYDIKAKFANIIRDNKIYDGISEHKLEPKIQMISLTPAIKLSLTEYFPVKASMGLLIAYSFNNGFYQSEKIISPNFINDINTGTKTRYEYNANKIPGFNNFIYGLIFGLEYPEIKLTDLIYFSPTFNINYTLNDLVKDLDWNYLGVQLGLNISYKFPYPENIPPKPAPLPDLPNPIKPKPIVANISTYLNDKELITDTILLQVKEKRFITTNYLFPIIFYNINSSSPIILTSNNVRTEEKIQSQPHQTIVNYLKKVDSIKIDVSYIETENPDTINKRISDIFVYLEKNGISKDKIQLNQIRHKIEEAQRQELLEDKCYIKFNFGKDNQLLNYMSDTLYKRFISPQTLRIKLIVENNSTYTAKSEIYIDNNLLGNYDKLQFYLDFDNNNLNNLLNLIDSKIKIKTTIKDIFNQGYSLEKEIFVKPQLVIDRVFENIISDYSQDSYVQQFILGYFEFDQSNFISINQNALNSINKAIKDGKLLEIIPLFDFLGTEEHNKQLALSRAEATLKLLGLNKEDVKITIPQTYFFSNDNPYGRMMNRSVIIRIKNIQ